MILSKGKSKNRFVMGINKDGNGNELRMSSQGLIIKQEIDKFYLRASTNQMYSRTHQQGSELERLREIERSNNHVNNLIENAKKMIYAQKQLTSTERQVLEIKISIEKDHLRKAFCKIDCPTEQLRVEIVTKSGLKHVQQHANVHTSNQRNYPIGSIRKNPKQEENRGRLFLQQTLRQEKQPNRLSKTKPVQKSNHNQPQQTVIYSDVIAFPEQQPDAQITISRYIAQNDEPSIGQHHQSVSVYQNQQSDQYEVAISNDRSQDTFYIHPSKNSKLVVKTRTEPITGQQHKQTASYFANREKVTIEEHTPSFSTYRKNRQETLNNQSSHQSSQIFEESSLPLLQDQININQDQININTDKVNINTDQVNINTPNHQLKIIRTSTEERLFTQPHVLPKKKSPKTQFINFVPSTPSSYQHYKSKQKLPDSEPSTSYKQILHKNKERLQSSKEKLSPYRQNLKTPKTPKYQLHIDKLHKKKSQSKKRLYGTTLESSPKPNESSLSSTTKKYSIANSHKVGSKAGDSWRKGKQSRKSLSTSKHLNSSMSPRKSPLHSTTLKSYHSPCSTCVKCKSTFSSPKGENTQFDDCHLAKKYLTAEGEQECYNFLRSQGILEADWGSYITEYVYRQLSRVYREKSPREVIGIEQYE